MTCSLLVIPGIHEGMAATAAGRLAMAAPQMVQIFFVLSGFALVHMLARTGGYGTYLIERGLRLASDTGRDVPEERWRRARDETCCLRQFNDRLWDA